MLVKSQALGSRVGLDCIDKQTWAQELRSETALHQAQHQGQSYLWTEFYGKKDSWCCILATLQMIPVVRTHQEVSQKIRGQMGRDGHPQRGQELDLEDREAVKRQMGRESTARGWIG